MVSTQHWQTSCAFIGAGLLSIPTLAASGISEDCFAWLTQSGPSATGIGNFVYAIAASTVGSELDDDGNPIDPPALFVGGNFSSAGGTPANRIARWNGKAWEPLVFGTANGVSSTVWSLHAFDDGLGDGEVLFVGGSFSTAGQVPTGSIARWNGSTWSPLFGANGGGIALGQINAMTDFDDGNGPALFVAGTFTAVDGNNINRIARWNGQDWAALPGPVGNGLNGTVNALAVFDDGNGPALYAGGAFTLAGGVGGTTVNRIARWDGNAWTALVSSTGIIGVNGTVNALRVHDDGNGPALYAAGDFIAAGGVTVNRIAKWDGTDWHPLEGANGSGVAATAWTLASFDAGEGPNLYVGGQFVTAGGIEANRIARWDGTDWSPLATGMSSTVRALLPHDDGFGPSLFAGGLFASIGGITVNFIARWGYPISADLNNDGVVDTDDLAILLGSFGCQGTDCAGDINRDGIVDTDDLSVLLGQFGNACR